ncbi:MAG: DUF192 domain-containing protein [Bacilli bacterium]|nr:DUF192 domain-containing protein [Bacilli bacterium]MDD4808475.1 DUF192 domain-containing protein [Bacilli bacterium]
MILNLNDKIYEIKEYTTFIERLKGLMFVRRPIDYVVRFNKCNAIHTFFMFQPIDIIMTDKEHNIVYIHRKLKPFRIILPKKKAYYTYELPKDITKYFMVKNKFIIEEKK